MNLYIGSSFSSLRKNATNNENRELLATNNENREHRNHNNATKKKTSWEKKNHKGLNEK
jgi:hypothetical protein